MWQLLVWTKPEALQFTNFFANFYFVWQFFSSINFYKIREKDFITICSMGINKKRMNNMNFIRPELQTQGQRGQRHIFISSFHNNLITALKKNR
jgi:hypothetical protein